MSNTTQLQLEGERKSLTVEIKAADKGEVLALFSRFKVKDFDDDWTLPGAFEDGSSAKISAYNHGSWSGSLPVGRGKIRITDDGAMFEGTFFMSTTHGRETFETIKAMGDLQEWSYGCDVFETGELTEELRQMGVRRVLQKLKVHEVSPVLVGAGIDTETLAVKHQQQTEQRAIHAASLKELGRFERTRMLFIMHR